MLRSNVEGTYAVLHGVVPHMRARSWGRIVNVSSVVAIDGAHVADSPLAGS